MKRRFSKNFLRAQPPSSTLLVRVSIGSIQLYQAFLRPFLTVWLVQNFGFVSQCKQNPTCSQYTIHQIRKHGTITGLKKGLIRFWNCR